MCSQLQLYLLSVAKVSLLSLSDRKPRKAIMRLAAARQSAQLAEHTTFMTADVADQLLC